MTQTLRKGWTTGACAAAAAKAAFWGFHTGVFPDPVAIRLPRGLTPSFALARAEMLPDGALAAVVKDAGDDPDVTHNAVIEARWVSDPEAEGVTLRAGKGVGTVTLPGLPMPVGAPSITPGPRAQILQNVQDAATRLGVTPKGEFIFSIPGGEALAAKTLNPRLGIVGGLSILGTNGVVIPYSCAAWAHSIRRGIDVARAMGLTHLAAATGKTSEAILRSCYDLPDQALLDMGDMAGALLAGLRHDPPDRLSLAGGPAKLSKLALGHTDLHSKATGTDVQAVIRMAAEAGAPSGLLEQLGDQATVSGVIDMAEGYPVAEIIARRARATVMAAVPGQIAVDVIVVARDGRILGRS
jgi:cobalt-precorrin-5B (C1)-methyltransferase